MNVNTDINTNIDTKNNNIDMNISANTSANMDVNNKAGAEIIGNRVEKTIYKTGEILIKNGQLTKEQLEFCLNHQRKLRQLGILLPIGEVILINNFASAFAVDNAIKQTKGLNAIRISDNIKSKYKIIVHGIDNDKLKISSILPLSEEDKEKLKKELLESNIVINEIINVSTNITDIINKVKEITTEKELLIKNIDLLNNDPQNGQILLQVMRGIFGDALEARASDIHIDKVQDEKYCWISYRIDGILRYKYLLVPQAMSSLCVRIKHESGMDISEGRRPQDGRISFRYKHRNIDMRVSTMPTSNDGETIAIRMLDPNALKSVSEIFKEYPSVAEQMRGLAEFKIKAGGIVVLSGPTGSGKTTTLYGLIKDMNRHSINIVTAEDPIEYKISNVRQTQVNPHIGLTFANILRTQVRQDPDVIVVGEIRDAETVETALRSAESGHLILTTVHAVDVKQSISRLAGMLPDNYKDSGMFVLANYLKAVINQRLVPKLCKCAVETTIGNFLDFLEQKEVNLSLSDDSDIELDKDSENAENADRKKRIDGLITCRINTDGTVGECVYELTKNVWSYDKAKRFIKIINYLKLKRDDKIKFANGCDLCANTGYYDRVLVAESAFFKFTGQKKNYISTNNDFDVEAILKDAEYYSMDIIASYLIKKGLIDINVLYDIINI